MSRAQGPADGGSRPSKTNRAGQRESFSPEDFLPNVRLTGEDGVTLREETTVRTTAGIDGVTWSRAVRLWRQYIDDSREKAAIFEGPEGRVEGGQPNRFMPGYADKQYAKLKDLERGLRENYGRRFHTAMVTLTASTTDEDDRARPPVDHLHDLDDSWEAVRRALKRRLDGRRWEYLAILEPHDSGHLHIHVAVFVDGVVTPETFCPVVEAHLRNCDGAAREAHQIGSDDEGGVVSVKHVGAERGEEQIGNLGTYLAEYLHTYGDDPVDAPAHQQAANAVLWATGKQRWRPSQGAQSYMAQNRSETDSAWELVAFRDAEGEVQEIEGAAGGGVARRVTCSRGSVPPPD